MYNLHKDAINDLGGPRVIPKNDKVGMWLGQLLKYNLVVLCMYSHAFLLSELL